MHTEPSTYVVPAPVLRVTNDCVRILLNEHAALRSLLRSILLMLERGPKDEPERFFDILRAMLFYVGNLNNVLVGDDCSHAENQVSTALATDAPWM